MNKMECGHDYQYRNWADDAPHYCIIHGFDLLKLENGEMRQLLWDLRKYIHEPNIQAIFKLEKELDSRLMACSEKSKSDGCLCNSFIGPSGCKVHNAEKRKCDCSCHPPNSQEQQCGACSGNHR